MATAGRRAAVRACGAMLVLDLLVAACAGGTGRTSGPPNVPPSASVSSARPSPATTREARAAGAASSTPDVAGRRVRLAFAGDVHFERRAAELLDDPDPLTDAVRGTLGAADFAMVNLETSLGTGGAPLPGKKYTFQAPVSALGTLAAVGVDAVSLANNHAVDFGGEVLAQTLAARETSPIPLVGIGRNADEAFTPLRVDIEGVRLAVLASSQIRDETSLQHAATASRPGIAANLDLARLRRAVREAAATSDVVVVMLHWGTQYTRCADDRQRRTAQALVADGADILVGGHAHRPQGAGWMGRSYVGWGLGNFVWYHTEDGADESGVLSLEVDADYARSTTMADDVPGRTAREHSVVVSHTWTPMLVGQDGVPRVTGGRTTARLAAAWGAATACGDLARGPLPHPG